MRFLLLLVALVLAPSVLAQDTPEAVATRMFEAMRAGNFDAVAAETHPDAQRSIHDFALMLAERDTTGIFMGMFFDEGTPGALRELPPEQAYARFIGAALRLQPAVMEALQTMRATILGTVYEGDSLAHVVQRSVTTVQGVSMTKMEVVSFKRAENGWKALLKGDIAAMTELIRTQLSATNEDDAP
ncbi:MAG: hypothetical protein LCH53_07450 [Bacteroidetes bacterium]|nr:hypothetical protein [Bacteroidota bacterium]